MIWYDGRMEAVTGDITACQVDAIINAANSTLLGGGGVDGAIHRVGGTDILEECRRIRDTEYPKGLPTGQAVVTGAGHLPCQYVIHTVGPVWLGGTRGEENLLADAYRNSLEKAVEAGVRTLAFPALSTGVYGYPADKAAKVAWRVLSHHIHHHSRPEKILLIFFSSVKLKAFLDAVT